MPDSFSTLIPEARAFFGKLAQNNTKDWWTTHKTDYEERLKEPALRLLDLVAAQLGPEVTPKLFRPHRDVRFSKDKTPYHLHLHMLWGTPSGPAYFFGISEGYARVGAGMMGFDKTGLTKWRAAVDTGSPLPDLIAGLLQQGYHMNEPELKRVPTPFPADHPEAEFLKRKSCVVWNDIAPGETDLPGALMGHFRRLTPLVQGLAAM